jgi:tetratricopeptide (TPR) repeat protein
VNAEEESAEEESAEKLKASFSANKTNKKTRKSKNNAVIASDSASIQVSKSVPEPSVSPILMSAYEAYNAGNDTEAQKLYKQVLQRDIRNVDALLGLGAIASRQGRSADANGWYGKVLEVDPRNNIAKTAMLDSQSQGNEQANETSLKNMLAKQPDDANLHVALGNLYAEQNQWPAAQQAYFDAYSLNKTADNAYNLAVSLDQMGKPKLALPYYQRALEQASDASNIDKAALRARIAVIQ